MIENCKHLKMAYLVVAVILFSFLPNSVRAHCDTENGPVAVAARKALQTGKFDTIAIWVGEKQEKELRERFEQCLAVYKTSGKAKSLSEQYLIETAVRLKV